MPSPAEEYVRLPIELTAENGAKAALMGEFHFGIDDANEPGGERKVTVPWTTIKEIHQAVVRMFGKPITMPGAHPDAINDARSIAIAWLDAYTDTEPLHLVPDAVKQVLTVMRALLAEPPRTLFRIVHADGKRWRTMDSIGMPDWTDDPGKALTTTLRDHIERYAEDDPEDVRVQEVTFVPPAAASTTELQLLRELAKLTSPYVATFGVKANKRMAAIRRELEKLPAEPATSER